MFANVKCPYCGKAFFLNRETYESYQEGISISSKVKDDDGSVIINCNVCMKPLRILMVEGEVQSIKKAEGEQSDLSKKLLSSNDKDTFASSISTPKRFKKLMISEYNTVIFPSKYSRLREIVTLLGISLFTLVYAFFIIVDTSKMQEKMVETQKSIYEKTENAMSNIRFKRGKSENSESPIIKKNSFGKVPLQKEFNPAQFLDNLKNIVDKHNENVKKQDEILKKIENDI